jgi:hypothetical protein
MNVINLNLSKLVECIKMEEHFFKLTYNEEDLYFFLLKVHFMFSVLHDS